MTSRVSTLLVSICLLAGIASAGAQDAVDASALVQKGRRLVADGDFAEGLALYTQALAAQPGLADAHLAAGIVLDLMGRYAEARRHLAQAIEQAPPELKANTLNAMATLVRLRAAHRRRGRVLPAGVRPRARGRAPRWRRRSRQCARDGCISRPATSRRRASGTRPATRWRGDSVTNPRHNWRSGSCAGCTPRDGLPPGRTTRPARGGTSTPHGRSSPARPR